MVFAVFVVMLGAGIITPLLPLYAEAFGATGLVVGLLFSSFGVARLVMDVPSGYLSDMTKRKTVIIAGLLLFAASGVVAAYAQDIVFLTLSRFVQGIGAAVFGAASVAYVADIAPVGSRGKYLGSYQGAFFLGSATGPAIGGVLAGLLGIRAPFLVLSLLAVGSAAFTQLFLPSTSAHPGIRRIKVADLKPILRSMIAHRKERILVMVSLMSFLVSSGIRYVGIPLFGNSVLGLDALGIGLAVSAVAMANFVIVFFGAGISDRLGNRSSLLIGFVATGIILLAFVSAYDMSTILLVGIVFGLSTGLMLPAQLSSVVEISDEANRGTVLGSFRMFNDLGIILGPLIVGACSDLLGIRFSFISVGLACLLLAIPILKLRQETHDAQPW